MNKSEQANPNQPTEPSEVVRTPSIARRMTFAVAAVAVVGGLGAAALGIGSASNGDDTSFNTVERQPIQQTVVLPAEGQGTLPSRAPASAPSSCNPLRGDLIDPTPCITDAIDRMQAEVPASDVLPGTGADSVCDPLQGDLIDPTPCIWVAWQELERLAS